MHDEPVEFGEERSTSYPGSKFAGEASSLREAIHRSDGAPVSPRLSFASFWEGDFSAYEAACLESFALRGYEVSLFSYDPVSNLPGRVTWRDAGDVIDRRDTTKAYLINGKPNLSHFSDIFRYRLCKYDRDMIWIDSDMLMLRRFDHALPRTVIVKEGQNSLASAILRLEDSGAVDRLIARAEALAGKELRWGQTGPTLLTRTFAKSRVLHEAYETRAFFPIHWANFWKVFLPEHRAECEGMCDGSYTVHLWNNIVVKLGVWKDILPPDGSFLNGLFRSDRTDRHFRGTYPADVMREMVENWRMRYTGVGLSVGQVVRQFGPSLLVTAKKHINKHSA